MKPFFLLSFLSLSLSVQFINCDGDLTFSAFLNKFYEKAKQEGISIKKPQLDFILSISNNIDNIQRQFEIPMQECMNVVQKNPSIVNIRHQSVGVKAIIHDSISDDLVKIRNIYKEIVGEIVYKPPIKYDQVFDNWMSLWARDPMDKGHVKNVQGQINNMKKVVRSLQSNFKKQMTAFDGQKAAIDRHIASTGLSLSELLKKTDLMNILTKFEPHTKRLGELLQALYKTLDKLKDILVEYNQRRTSIVEFLIGIKGSPTSERKTLNTDLLAGYMNINENHYGIESDLAASSMASSSFSLDLRDNHF